MKMLDFFLSLLYQSEVRGNVVIKKYSWIKGLKWLPAKLLLPSFPYSLNPSERLFREVNFLLSDLPTPKLLAVGKNFLIREYLDGEILGPKPKEIAEALWNAHKRGWALGDAKYDNFLLKNGELYYLDGEQAIRDNRYAFADLVVGAFFLMLKLGCEGVEDFFNHYPDEGTKAKAKRLGLLLLFPCLRA